MSSFDPASALEQLSLEYRGRIEAIRRDLTSSHSTDSAEQAAERQNDQVLEALLAETEGALRQVERARERLRAGTYGICSKCGEAIGASRLAALPMAECCLNCAD
ncbi:TraR/DksA family transcriptional regulator [Pseudomonas sp. N040]|uniref:TraR/DksA family transcriptional regulator n=1 Tax=Pseudomonas sp. N040 TaxID=2785325 RepID=UPI0018A32F32|nr:TraR/DksA family transcriptional regulator [Pseudomonas sp. N040]MBF7730218.1 TraR/DksA family transcriptional regulator [Pseudomonas sp. N040]MBW7013860.1 TraR/DksA family transcriptional regulator [Pseudomonas sp. N040]